jgi:uncharacterized membrane protein YfcA
VLFIAIGLALLVGATLGLFGGGGAVLAVPIFVYVLDVPAKSALAMSFLVIGAASSVGSVDRWWKGQLDPRRGVWLGLAAVVGAFAGARLGVFLPDSVQLTLFGGAVLFAAASLLRTAERTEEPRAPRSHLTGAVVFALIGAFTGVVGVGGGFLFVPALVAIVGVPMVQALGLSLMVVAMNATAAFAGYLGHVPIDWRLASIFTAAVITGMIPAGRLAHRVPVPILKRSFAIVLLAVGAFVLFDNIR